MIQFMPMLKNKKTLLIPIFIVLTSFLWSQFVWAYGLPLQNEVPSKPEEPVKNLPINIQEQFPKEFCSFPKNSQILTKNNPDKSSPENIEKKPFSSVKERTGDILKVAFLANPTPQIPPQFYPSCGAFDRLGRVQEKVGTIDGESYHVTYKEYDSLGRALRWTEEQGDAEITHSRVIYNEIGQIISEYIEVEVSQGSGIFESSSETLTHYEYSYDIHGTRETTLEDEIYSKTSSNPIGKIVKAIVSVVTIAVTWGMATPFVAAVMAVENMVFNVLSGMDFKDALIGAAISFAATCIGMQFGELLSGTSVAAGGVTGVAGFLKDGSMTMLFEALSLADSLMADDQGRGLFEQVFGKWGSVVFQAISIGAGLMNGGGGINGPPYQLYAGIGKLIVSAALTAAGDKIHPYLRQFISAFSNSFFNSWAEGMTIRHQMETSLGHEIEGPITVTKQYDETGERLLTYTAETESGQYVFNAGMQIMSYTNQTGTTWYRDGEAVQFTMQGITETVYDEMGMPIYSKLESGDLIAYDSNGFFAGYIQEGSEIYWKDGELYSSKDFDGYTNYYNSYGEKQYTIIDGYTPIERNGQVIGQYKDISDDTYIYRDANGNFVNKITITEEGIYQNDGNWTTYFNNSNTKEWARANTEHSPIFYYNEQGDQIIGIMSTVVNESGLVEGKIYHNLVDNEYTFYDADGNQLLPTINPGEIIQGVKDTARSLYTRIIEAVRTELSRDDIVLEGKLFDKVPVIDLRNEGASSDPILNYLSLGLSIFDPTGGAVQLLLNGLLNNPTGAAVYGEFLEEASVGDIAILIKPDGVAKEDFIAGVNEDLMDKGLSIINVYDSGGLLQVKLGPLYYDKFTEKGLANPDAPYMSKEQLFFKGMLERIFVSPLYADALTGTPDGFMELAFPQLTAAFEALYERGDYEGYTAVDAYKGGSEYRSEYKETYRLAKEMLNDPELLLRANSGEYLRTAIGNIRAENLEDFLTIRDDISELLSRMTGSEKATLRTVMLKQAMIKAIGADEVLQGKYLGKVLEIPEHAYGDMTRLQNGKPVLISIAGYETPYIEALSPAGMQAVTYSRYDHIGAKVNVEGFIWNGEVLKVKFGQSELQASEAAFALVGQVLAINKACPNQLIILQSHSLGARVIGEAIKILDTLGYSGENRIVDIAFLTGPAIDRNAFNIGGEFYESTDAVGRIGVFFSDKDDIVGWIYPAHRVLVDQERLSFNVGMGEKGPINDYTKAQNVKGFDLTPNLQIDPITHEEYWASELGRDALIWVHGDYFRAHNDQIGGMYDKMWELVDDYKSGRDW